MIKLKGNNKIKNLENIVFFDGYCVLCNGFVDFLIKTDKNNNLKYGSLQGKTAQEILKENYLNYSNTVVFYKSTDNIYEKSNAVIEIVISIGGIWKLFNLFKIFPEFLLNYIYDLVAKHRNTIFGKRDSCRVPSKEEKDKILP